MDEGTSEQEAPQPSARETVGTALLKGELGLAVIPTTDEQRGQMIGSASSDLKQILGDEGTTAIRALTGVALLSGSERTPELIDGRSHKELVQNPQRIMSEINSLSADLQRTILGDKGVKALRVLLGASVTSGRDSQAVLSLGSGAADLTPERMQDESYATGIVMETLTRLSKSPAAQATEPLKRIVALAGTAYRH